MAVVLKSREYLKKLYDILEQGHAVKKLSPLGALKSTLLNNWSYEAVVDHWPDVTSVILRPNPTKCKDFPFKYTDVYVYSDNKHKFKKLVQSGEVFPKDYPYGIPVCPIELVDVIEEGVQAAGGHVQRKGPLYCATLSCIEKDPQQYLKNSPQLARFTYGPIQEQDLEMIFSLWNFDRKTTKEYWLPLMKQMITINPSICAFDEEGNAVSWSLIHLDGCVMMAYTKPKYRNLGVLPAISVMIGQLPCAITTFGYAPKPIIHKVHYVNTVPDSDFQFLQCVNVNSRVKSSVTNSHL